MDVEDGEIEEGAILAASAPAVSASSTVETSAVAYSRKRSRDSSGDSPVGHGEGVVHVQKAPRSEPNVPPHMPDSHESVGEFTTLVFPPAPPPWERAVTTSERKLTPPISEVSASMLASSSTPPPPEEEEEGQFMSPPRAPVHATQYEEIGPLPKHSEWEEHDGPSFDEGEILSLGDNLVATGTPENATSPNLVDSKSPALVLKKEQRQKAELRAFIGCSPIDEYRMEKKIGEGTFGEVTTMIQVKTQKRFALKRILMANEREGIPITALREIKILKSLNHKNIVQLTEMAVRKGDKQTRQRGEIYMVFPYMDHDLTGLLENPNVCFTPAQIKSYTHQLMDGMRHLHMNHILHRDMKTANILVDSSGNLRIADFGLARAEVSTNPKYTNLVVTRWYRPPELFLGVTDYGPAIDMWGVGCVFGEILRRRPILTGSTDLDQVDKIWQLCGTPTEQNWPGFKELLKNQNVIKEPAQHLPRTLRQKFNMFILDTRFEGAVELLDELLALDPKARITADAAMSHRYFYTPPKRAEPNTPEYVPRPRSSIVDVVHSFNDNWESSHELGSRLRRSQAAEIASALPGFANPLPTLPPHYNVNARGRGPTGRGQGGGGGGRGQGGGGGGASGGGFGGGGGGDWGRKNDHRRDADAGGNDWGSKNDRRHADGGRRNDAGEDRRTSYSSANRSEAPAKGRYSSAPNL